VIVDKIYAQSGGNKFKSRTLAIDISSDQFNAAATNQKTDTTLKSSSE